MSATIPLFNLPNPAGHSPPRRLNSVRRTSSIDVTWPAGKDSAMNIEAVGRDFYTAATLDECHELSLDRLDAVISPNRTISAISAQPHRQQLSQLVGCRGGGRLRSALQMALPAAEDRESPLYLLVDDLAGVSLVAGWAWSCWPELNPVDADALVKRETARSNMEGVCIGFSPGFESMTHDVSDMSNKRASDVVSLVNPDDVIGWHSLPDNGGVTFRRARRIDVWQEAGFIHIHAGFQDSASTPEGKRTAVHEYSLHVCADTHTQRISAIHAIPHILPFNECPLAINGIQRLLGTPLETLRQTVPETLPKILGCTHLNDLMRALAEAPVLCRQLNQSL